MWLLGCVCMNSTSMKIYNSSNNNINNNNNDNQ